MSTPPLLISTPLRSTPTGEFAAAHGCASELERRVDSTKDGQDGRGAGGVLRLSDSVTLILGDCLDGLPRADHVIADPPFSARTHKGHDAGANGATDRLKSEFVRADGRVEKPKYGNRQTINYAAWTANEVRAVCQALPKKGWACFLTDHTLAREWERELLAVGRYVFAPLPCVIPGRSVRLNGDGPSSWTDWLIVSRTAAECRWGTLPGYYEGRPGSIEHMGGKPLNMMCRIVEDYTREGDTVLDLCMGSGTTGIACIRTGRKFIGIERDPVHFETARKRINAELEECAFEFPKGRDGGESQQALELEPRQTHNDV